MRTILGGIVLALNIAGAQPVPSGVGASPVPSLLPQNWVGLGAGYNAGEHPRYTEWTSYATLINQTAKAYSYSTLVTTRVGSIVVNEPNTGVALMLRQFGPHVYLFGFMLGGTSQTATALQLQLQEGGILVYRATSGLTFEAIMKGANRSATGKVIEFGIGWSK